MARLRILAGMMLACSAYAVQAHAADLDSYKKELEPFTKKPEFVAPGAGFDAKKCMAGKTIFSIPVSSANPFTKNIETAMSNVAKEVGFKFIEWQNQGQVSQWAQGMDQAINQKVDLIDLLAGTDPRVLVPQVEAAKKAGIPVVASHYNGLEQKAEHATHDVPIDYFKAGQLLVDWAMVQTGGKLNSLVLISTGPLSTDSTSTALSSPSCAPSRRSEAAIRQQGLRPVEAAY
jgi:ribose transport system substrate-binding protein